MVLAKFTMCITNCIWNEDEDQRRMRYTTTFEEQILML